jgi:hypothetical protein
MWRLAEKTLRKASFLLGTAYYVQTRRNAALFKKCQMPSLPIGAWDRSLPVQGSTTSARLSAARGQYGIRIKVTGWPGHMARRSSWQCARVKKLEAGKRSSSPDHTAGRAGCSTSSKCFAEMVSHIGIRRSEAPPKRHTRSIQELVIPGQPNHQSFFWF